MTPNGNWLSSKKEVGVCYQMLPSFYYTPTPCEGLSVYGKSGGGEEFRALCSGAGLHVLTQIRTNNDVST